MSFLKKEVLILKESASAADQVNRLEELFSKARGDLAQRMERDIAMLKAGIAGEENILFELKNSGMDLIVLQDIYLENDNLSAQIDFYVITPKFNVVIECKNLYGNIEINNNGDFIRTIEYQGRKWKEGIYSPITQNERHLEVLKSCLLKDANILQKAIIQKSFGNFYKSLVVLANPKTVVNDRYAKKEIKQNVLRADQLIATLKRMEAESNEIADSMKRMKERAQWVLQLHKENKKDYVEKYERLLAEMDIENPHEAPDSDLSDNTAINDLICPACDGTLRLIKGQYGDFYGCSNYRSKGCTYKRKA